MLTWAAAATGPAVGATIWVWSATVHVDRALRERVIKSIQAVGGLSIPGSTAWQGKWGFNLSCLIKISFGPSRASLTHLVWSATGSAAVCLCLPVCLVCLSVCLPPPLQRTSHFPTGKNNFCQILPRLCSQPALVVFRVLSLAKFTVISLTIYFPEHALVMKIISQRLIEKRNQSDALLKATATQRAHSICKKKETSATLWMNTGSCSNLVILTVPHKQSTSKTHQTFTSTVLNLKSGFSFQLFQYESVWNGLERLFFQSAVYQLFLPVWQQFRCDCKSTNIACVVIK